MSMDVKSHLVARRKRARLNIADLYISLGFIAAGTYGRVFKAMKRSNNNNNDNQTRAKEYAIKKFKPDKEGELALHTGISQSACREISLCRELSHENIVALAEVLLDPVDRSIYMVFEYAEHDLLVSSWMLLFLIIIIIISNVTTTIIIILSSCSLLSY